MSVNLDRWNAMVHLSIPKPGKKVGGRDDCVLPQGTVSENGAGGLPVWIPLPSGVGVGLSRAADHQDQGEKRAKHGGLPSWES
jgi:hypothetical protein